MASYSDSIKISSFYFRRDPHLPSPEVCDWLLAQEWSKPGRINYQSTDSSGCIEECGHSYAGIGANEMIDLFLPAGALEILREDAKARAALGWIQAQSMIA
jgi:hypothetical protein